MLHISCPSCGERGKIPANLVGARIKCKKCGNAFQVASASRPPAAVVDPTPREGSPPAFEGIAVEGFDHSSWSLAPESSTAMPIATDPGKPDPAPDSDAAAEPAPHAGPTKEYKLLTSRDKIFEGKFDLARLEDVINQYARQGWVAKTMCLPHLKNYQGALQEEVVVLLER